LFLDSGAFSAYTQGVQVSIDDYIEFIKEHEGLIAAYANLDVINDPQATLRNQKRMEKAGLHPIPCYHLGEPVKFLKEYVSKYDYIAMGGMVRKATSDGLKVSDSSRPLDRLFTKYICDKDGMPKVKVHGFGLTTLKLMLRYPWYSVDSTSWVVASRMGQIYVPRFRKGNWVYNETAWVITISSSAGRKRKGSSRQHFVYMTEHEQEQLLAYLKSKGMMMGKSEFHKEGKGYKLKADEQWVGKAVDGKRVVERRLVDGVSNCYWLRDEINILFFKDLENQMPAWPWPFKASTTGFKL